LFGISAGVELHELWAMEFAAATTFGIPANPGPGGLGADVFLGVGVTPRIAGRRAEGWLAQWVWLLGYRNLKRVASPDGADGSETTQGMQIEGGFAATRWAHTMGFSLRLLVGETLPLHQERTGYWADHEYFSPSEDLRYATSVGLDVGVAFGGTP
jgi:hypothetical protein